MSTKVEAECPNCGADGEEEIYNHPGGGVSGHFLCEECGFESSESA